MVKQKANGDEIDSLNTLLHELYERIVDIEKNGTGKGHNLLSSGGNLDLMDK